MKRYKSIGILILTLTCFLWVFNQQKIADLKKTQQQMESEKKKMIEKISITENLIKEQEERSTHYRHQGKLIDANIRERQNLINILEAETNQLINVIGRKQKIIDALEKDLEAIKKEYRHLLIDAYRHNNGYNRLLFIFQSTSFNDLVERLRYIEHYRDYRQKQAELIIETRFHINKKINELNNNKDKKIARLNDLDIQRKALNKDKNKINQHYRLAQNQKKELKKEIDQYKSKKKELDQKIQSVIQEIIRVTKMGNTKLAKEFSKNKGSLRWPIPMSEAVVTGQFGKKPHPVYPSIMIENSGIDITCKKNIEVASIFEGKVVQVMISPAFQKAIIIRHGNYFTVYSNLKEVYVDKDDKLKTGDKIGKVFTDNEGITELHFEVWKEEETVDPQKWLIK
ncbi:MAG: murein hydrolase activator EnvC family protein [Crocinitomicaceae bacterium]